MKQDYTMYIYKADRRKKSGERLVSTTVWTDRDAASMAREAQDAAQGWKVRDGYRIEYFSATEDRTPVEVRESCIDRS